MAFQDLLSVGRFECTPCPEPHRGGKALGAASGPAQWVLDCVGFASQYRGKRGNLPRPCSTEAFTRAKRRKTKATTLAAPHPALGVMNEPIWRSLDPTLQVKPFVENTMCFGHMKALVKVSFGERHHPISPKNKIGTLSADQHCQCRFSTHFFYIYINYELLTTYLYMYLSFVVLFDIYI